MHRIQSRVGLRKTGCMLMCILLLVPMIFASAQELKTAGEREQHVRVLLSRLKLTDRMDLTLTASYQLLMSNGSQMHFQPQSELTFLLNNGKIYLYYQGMSQEVGERITLNRSGEESGDKTGFYLTNFPALYMGDLQLDIAENALRAILTIHVEDYLLGVVPYEMSNSFPLEALKAQAVAARTYALRNQNQYDDYDVVDTTNDQVFKGYTEGNERAEQAVLETRGICGFYKGKLAQCYYAASNGGQTELVENVWPTDEDFGYYASGDDPYDLANPESLVRQFKLKKRYNNETAPYALRLLLAEKLAETLEANGFDPSPESIRVDRVNAVSVDTPNRSGSKLMTMLHLTLEISARSRRDVLISVVDLNSEEVSLFAVNTPQDSGRNENFVPVVTLPPTPSPEPEYGPFVPLTQTVVLDIPVFPDAEEALGLDVIGNYENEIWSVTEDAGSFIIEARRYGHGVGMSQRGAQWMAGEHGMDYQEILGFYYSGMELKQYNEQKRRFVSVENAFSFTPGPAPSPTPRPTLMPVTQAVQEGQWYAEVTEITEDSSLNLRSEPSLNGDILMRIYKGQRLLVLEHCPQEGWVHVKTDTAEGYVMESYLSRENQ